MKSAIKVTDLHVQKSKTLILKGVSFEIQSGKIVGLLGPSGAGKTTLIRSIVGLQKITDGSAEVLGHLAGSRELRGRIGYMAQSSAVYDDLSVRQNLLYFAAVIGVKEADVAEIIEQVELTNHASQLAGSLSGGQRTRVSLAIALLGHPPILILDEPTVGLDPRLRQEFWRAFRDLAAGGTSILISSHVMDEARHCDDLLLIGEGQLLAQDSPRVLCSSTGSETIEDAFLKLTEAK